MNPPLLDGMLDLRSCTTLRVGGKARHACKIKTQADFKVASDQAKALGVFARLLGGGSNLVVDDGVHEMLACKVETKGITVASAGEHVFLTVEAGEDWDDFVQHCVGHGYQGIECLSGIPGTVGATPIQNVGAYGQDVSQVIESVLVWDCHQEESKTLLRNELNFSYRNSALKTQKHLWVMAVVFKLKQCPSIQVSGLDYGELRKECSGLECSLQEIREVVLRLRRGKGMLLENGLCSAGSFFTNPIVDCTVVEGLKQKHPTMPYWDMEQKNRVKLSAGWLIEHAGYKKGYRSAQHQHRVGLSPLHALCVVNHNHASATDIMDFAREIQEHVQASFGVKLDIEPERWIIAGGS